VIRKVDNRQFDFACKNFGKHDKTARIYAQPRGRPADPALSFSPAPCLLLMFVRLCDVYRPRMQFRIRPRDGRTDGRLVGWSTHRRPPRHSIGRVETDVSSVARSDGGRLTRQCIARRLVDVASAAAQWTTTQTMRPRMLFDASIRRTLHRTGT